MKPELISIGKNAKQASILLASLDTKTKNKALLEMAKAIQKNEKKIILANEKDLIEAQKNKINPQLINRLKLDRIKLKEIIQSIKETAKLEDPVRIEISKTKLDTNLILSKITCPIGVIGVIFESRPDALSQIASLCLKSGNAVLLKGGSEAKYSNKILFDIISEAQEKVTKIKNAIQLLETRAEVNEMLKLDQYINLIIPRGSNSLVKYIQDHTKIAVLGHAEGICHVYIDNDADLNMAVKIAVDSKCQYPAVCNATETLLVHKAIAKKFLPKVAHEFEKQGVELRGCQKTKKVIFTNDASETDWKTEYGDLILSIKTVDDINEAIRHINSYGSGHTDAIVTKNQAAAEKFVLFIDSSSVVWNASTRFADGYRYGLGAEVGISTNKIHARGPVGLEGLVIYKYILKGTGHIVANYTGEKARKFIHKKIK